MAQLSNLNWINLAAYMVNIVVTFASSFGIFGPTNQVLSKKYQTVITPAGWAFSIWGPIFIWEAAFTSAQLTGRFSASPTVRQVAPWWWATCFFQVCWTLTFSRQWIVGSLICMLGIFCSLFGLLWAAPWPEKAAGADLWVLRAPFSLHAGWILAATLVNVNIQADSMHSSATTMVSLAVISIAVAFAVVAVLTFNYPGPDPIIALVLSWALFAITSELSKADKLKDPTRFNPYTLDELTIRSVKATALTLAFLSLVLALVASLLRVRTMLKQEPARASADDQIMLAAVS